VWSELVLAGPISVIDLPPVPRGTPGSETMLTSPAAGAGDVADAGSQTELLPPPDAGPPVKRFAFDAPRIKILISIKTDPGASAWTPCAELDIALKQGVQPQFFRPTSLSRAVMLDLEKHPQIEMEARYVSGYSAEDASIDVERLKEIFRNGWSEYMYIGEPPHVGLPDIDLGYTKLRAAAADWKSPILSATFGPAGVKLTNSTDQALVYETKGPYSGWGGPFTLKAGDSHDYAIAYPLVFRRRTATGYMTYTLPSGSHSEYRIPPAGGQPALFQAREQAEIDKARRLEQEAREKAAQEKAAREKAESEKAAGAENPPGGTQP
jgi:hypothetical protein